MQQVTDDQAVILTSDQWKVVLEYLHTLVANCDREGGPHNALLAGFFATTANEIAGGVHLADKADGVAPGGGS